jgi:hypothetical protein
MQTLSANGNLRRQLRPPAGSKGNGQEQNSICPVSVPADGFLRHRFLPLYEPGEQTPPEAEAGEQYFRSLQNLYSLQSLEPFDVSGKPYPYSILLTHWYAGRALTDTNPDIELTIVQDENRAYCLSARETMDMGRCLYYIPVLPLYRLMENRKTKRAGQLLLGVFSYLYKYASVPYYRNPSYLETEYEMLKDWLEQDDNFDEENKRVVYQSQFNEAEYFGDIMRKRIAHPYAMDTFPHRVENFRPKNEFERDCLRIAEKTLNLYHAYPMASIYNNVPDPFLNEEDDDYDYYESPIRIDEYISFVAEIKGKVYDSLYDMINTEFQERSEMLEPEIITLYNGENKSVRTLDFERRLIAIIDDVVSLLDD